MEVGKMAIKFKKVSLENNKHTLVMIAMQLGIKGSSTMDPNRLVTLINKKANTIQVSKSPSTPRVASKTKVKVTKIQKTLEELGYTQDEVVTISGRVVGGKQILEGRRMKVTGSKGENLIGFLISDKDGSLQRSEILMPKANTFKLEVAI